MRIPLIWIALCLAACAGAERDITRLGPKPPVERFPDAPYVAPPTPEEVAAAKADRETLRAARAARRAAVSNLLAAAGIEDAPTADPAKIKARAAAIEAAVAAMRKGRGK